MDLQAAIGMHQIKRVERYWQRRLEIWNRYNSAFADLPVTIPVPLDKQSRHALHLYTVLINEDEAGITRDEFITRLHIHCDIRDRCALPIYPSSSCLSTSFRLAPEDYPNAQAIGQSTVSLPLSAKLSNEKMWRMLIQGVRHVLNADR